MSRIHNRFLLLLNTHLCSGPSDFTSSPLCDPSWCVSPVPHYPPPPPVWVHRCLSGLFLPLSSPSPFWICAHVSSILPVSWFILAFSPLNAFPCLSWFSLFVLSRKHSIWFIKVYIQAQSYRVYTVLARTHLKERDHEFRMSYVDSGRQRFWVCIPWQPEAFLCGVCAFSSWVTQLCFSIDTN